MPPKMKASSRNIKTEIQNTLNENDGNLTGNKLRELMFERGFNIPEVNVKLAMMRQKGEIILENGVYRTVMDTKLKELQDKQTFGFHKHSDVSVVNKLFKSSSKINSQCTRNEIPLQILLASFRHFTKRCVDTSKLLPINREKTSDAVKKKNETVFTQYRAGNQSFSRNYIEQHILNPSIDKLMMNSNQTKTERSTNSMMAILKRTKKFTKENKRKCPALSVPLIYKHAFILASKNSNMNILLRAFKNNIDFLKFQEDILISDKKIVLIKQRGKPRETHDWSVLQKFSQSDLRIIISKYISSFKKWKFNIKTGKLKDHNSPGFKTGACTYDGCNRQTVEVTNKNPDIYFKNHVIGQHLNLTYEQCDYCAIPVSFASEGTAREVRKKHCRKLHMPIQLFTFACSLCPEKFAGKNELYDHLKSRHSGNQFVCFVCGPRSKIFATLANINSSRLQAHLKEAHNIVLSSSSLHQSRSGIKKYCFIKEKQTDEAQKLLKNHGLELDKDYPESKFAMVYNSEMNKIFADIMKNQHVN